MLRVWNLSLVIATFSLTILGTFLTRSGVIDSVHAFTQSDDRAVVARVPRRDRGNRDRSGRLARRPAARARAHRLRGLARVGLPRQQPAVRRARVRGAARHGVPAGRGGGSVVRGSRSGEPYFDRMATPIGLALLFLMAAAPALPWRATSGEVVRNRLMVPAWIGGLTMLGAVVLGTRGLAEILAYGLGAFATAGIVRQFVLGIRGRRRALGESRAVALGRSTRSNPRLYGGLVVHFGVVLHRGRLGRIVGLRRQPRREAPARRIGDGIGLHADLPGRAHRPLGRRRSPCRPTCAWPRATGCSAPMRPPSPRFRNSTEGIGTPSVHTGLARRRVPHAGVVAERTEPGHARRTHQPDDRVALDRRRVHGARHHPRPGAPAAAPGAATPGGSGRAGTRAGARLERAGFAGRGDGVKHPARCRRARRSLSSSWSSAWCWR